MSTKRKGDSCYDKAGEDEPIFVLRAQDALASRVVRYWASLARDHNCPGEKVDEALNLADDIDRWPDKKIPD